MPKRSILDDLYESAKGLHRSGVLGEDRMRYYEQIRPIPGSYSPADIRRIREAAGEDTDMFARHLGVTPETVEKWEAGTSKPAGPVRRLLDLIDRKGIAAIY